MVFGVFKELRVLSREFQMVFKNQFKAIYWVSLGSKGFKGASVQFERSLRGFLNVLI